MSNQTQRPTPDLFQQYMTVIYCPYVFGSALNMVNLGLFSQKLYAHIFGSIKSHNDNLIKKKIQFFMFM